MLFGLSALVRPISLVFVVVVLVCARRARVATWVAVGLFVLATVVTIAPWTIRNRVSMRAFVPVSTNTGDDLCIGHHPHASGGFGFPHSCVDAKESGRTVAAEISGDHYATHEALRFAVAHPLAEVPLAAKRIWASIRNDSDSVAASEAYGDDVWMQAGLRRGLGIASNLFWWVLFAAALMGVVVVARARPRVPAQVVLLAPVALVLIPTVVFFGDPRFKTPGVPFLAILAAAALESVRARRTPSLVEATLGGRG
ncbi:MAG TPA: hypothetical protein VGO03_00895 [Acidimicrobiia bacterium]